jgi:hypothetical protein
MAATGKPSFLAETATPPYRQGGIERSRDARWSAALQTCRRRSTAPGALREVGRLGMRLGRDASTCLLREPPPRGAARPVGTPVGTPIGAECQAAVAAGHDVLTGAAALWAWMLRGPLVECSVGALRRRQRPA